MNNFISRALSHSDNARESRNTIGVGGQGMIKKHISVVVEVSLFLILLLVLREWEMSWSLLAMFAQFIVYMIIARFTEVMIFKEFEVTPVLAKHKWVRSPLCFLVIGAEIYLCRCIVNTVFYDSEYVYHELEVGLGFLYAFDHLLVSYVVDILMGTRKTIFDRLRDFGNRPLDEYEAMPPFDEQEDDDSDPQRR